MDTEENGNAPHVATGTVLAIVVGGVGLLGVLTFALLYPLPPLSRVGRTILDMGHAPAFAAVTIVLFRLACGLRPSSGLPTLLVIGAAMAIFGYASEVVQSICGRGYALQDIMADVLGVIAGVCWVAKNRCTRAGSRVCLALVSVVALLIASTSPAMIFVDVARQKAALPLLASFESETELSRWVVREGRMSRVSIGTTDGVRALRVDLDAGRYPGVTMIWPESDWSNYDDLVFDVTVPEERNQKAGEAAGRQPPPALILKVEDASHDGSFEDRFHRQLRLTHGLNEVRVPLTEIEHALSSRRMDLREISIVQLFLSGPTAPHTFFVDHLRLE